MCADGENRGQDGLTRREFLSRTGKAGLGVALGATMGASRTEATGSRPKNVLLLMTDEHHSRALSCMGHKFALTPSPPRRISPRQGRRAELWRIRLRAEDPGEERNLADGPSCATLRKRLLEQLVAWIRQTQDPWLAQLPVG